MFKVSKKFNVSEYQVFLRGGRRGGAEKPKSHFSFFPLPSLLTFERYQFGSHQRRGPSKICAVKSRLEFNCAFAIWRTRNEILAIRLQICSPFPFSMLRVDFGQSLLDHCGVLILVQPVGYIGDKRFKAIYDEISTYRRAQVPNTTRTLNLRYSKRVTPQFIEWGNFHFHKRVLGLICVGRCSEISEVEKLEKLINEIKNPFSAILLNTTCFVFDCKSCDEAKIRKDFALIRGEDHSEDLQSNLAEFVATLFNVLESKRFSKLSEKIDKITLIQAPVEHEVFGGENDNR